MLVLSRKPGETVQIGEGCELVVLDVQGKRIRLGIRAPKHVCVRRGELRETPERMFQQAPRHSVPITDDLTCVSHATCESR